MMDLRHSKSPDEEERHTSTVAATLRRQLLALSDGEQAGTTMPRLLHGLSDHEVEALVRELTATWRDTP